MPLIGGIHKVSKTIQPSAPTAAIGCGPGKDVQSDKQESDLCHHHQQGSGHDCVQAAPQPGHEGGMPIAEMAATGLHELRVGVDAHGAGVERQQQQNDAQPDTASERSVDTTPPFPCQHLPPIASVVNDSDVAGTHQQISTP